MRTIVRSGLEESTWTQYGKHVDLYRTFLEDPQESGATSDERHMLRFAGKLFEQGMQPRTITSVWAAVARYRELRQWPQLEGPLMALFRKGVKKHQRAAPVKRPLAAEAILNILDGLALSDGKLRLQQLGILLAFTCFLRSNTIGHVHLIDLVPIVKVIPGFFVSDKQAVVGFTLRLTREKFGSTNRVMHVESPWGARLLSELQQSLLQTGSSFTDICGPTSEWAELLQPAPAFGYYAFHSVRKGAASNALCHGIPLHAVQRFGGWSQVDTVLQNYAEHDYIKNPRAKIFVEHLSSVA